MEWTQIPVVQLGALGVLLAVLWLVFRGHLVPSTLVPRSTLDDVRSDRDTRLAEANQDAADWRDLYVRECEAHDLTRRAHAEEIRAALLASTEGAQVAAVLLAEIRSRQIEAGSS
ncbi:hypothetical protein E1286_05260 [Nonomuraea terrae]|uniref:Uncharacterized protein n=1 Tax=Nonomuraea terrae TaxID=2530383 RepID=A0A4R4ZBP3_9ACTN|nr:hypothetical protein [Nonomuraea terrae]TDD54599.1 hypothetical protein E1286_05260 [Nonomuraea terrae]